MANILFTPVKINNMIVANRFVRSATHEGVLDGGGLWNSRLEEILTELAQTRRGVNNYNVAVKEYGDQIIFLRQIVPGASDRSYGIHVAKLAGIPAPVIERANVILELLEKAADAPRDAIAQLPRNTVRSRRRKGREEENDDMIQLRLL